MKSADRVTGAILAIFALLCFRETLRIGGGWEGAGTMTLIVGVMLAVSSLVLVLAPSAKSRPVHWPGRQELTSIGVISGAFACYIYVIEWLGYALTTWLFLIVVSKRVSPSRLHVILLWTGAVAVGTYIVFKKYLYMYLPEGVIGF